MRRHFVAAVRLARGMLHLLAGLWILQFGFAKKSTAQRNQTVQAWAARLLRLVGIDLQIGGSAPAEGPVLLVANHISWLDIVVLLATRHCRFVSKSEIRQWPVVGALASGAGTLYIERACRRDAMRVVHHVAERLREGDVIAVFPEGAIGDGINLLPFHANLLQAALSADVPAQPVALVYADAATGQVSLAPRYTQQDSLLVSVWRTLSAPPIAAHVQWGAAQTANGRDRRAWARALAGEIQDLRVAGVPAVAVIAVAAAVTEKAPRK